MRSALEFYNSLLTKMNESSMATALEQPPAGRAVPRHGCSQSSRRADIPESVCLCGRGLCSGLFLGLLLAALLEYRDTSLRNERDVWAFTKLPTLAIISRINGLTQPAKPHSRRKLVLTNE